MLLLPGTELSVTAAVWLLLDVAFLAALLLHLLLGGYGCRSPLWSVFQDLLRYGKTKLGQQRPAWLHHFDLPKRWFSHFYYLSVIWNGALLWLVCRTLLSGAHMPVWLESLLYLFNKEPHQKTSGEELSTILALSLIWLHSLGRLAECRYVSVFSSGVINLAQYCLGIGFYIFIGITLLDHPQLDVKTVTISDLASQLHWYHVMGMLVFCWASVHQHRCLVILASLRKNKSGKVVSLTHAVPRGDWFEMVSCPHYFAELLIYISVAMMFGFAHTTWWLVVLFVLFNQSGAAVLCHEFYHEKFEDYPAHRKALIPYLF
ncbi:polyprenol reductase [Hyperolius riggenbachi]|uniref:polyprenol reductase n=1 Tax=Hyperolius riggenbachi TaxID=752182 RepID=UPI0035A26C26